MRIRIREITQSVIEDQIKYYGLKLAVRYRLKPGGAGIQLYDAEDRPLEGHEAYWDGSLYVGAARPRYDIYWPDPVTSLDGCPRVVTGNFDCRYNLLESLAGAPLFVGGNFYCQVNRLTSLEGGPKLVGGHYNCQGVGLESLRGAPEHIGGHFDCSRNRLKDLRGGPRVVGGEYDCSYNRPLTSLAGCPDLVGWELVCEGYILPKDYVLPEDLRYRVRLDDPAA